MEFENEKRAVIVCGVITLVPFFGLCSSICEDVAKQPDIFQVEEQHSLQEVITEETMKSATCSCYSIPCSMAPCVTSKPRAESAESDSGLSSS